MSWRVNSNYDEIANVLVGHSESPGGSFLQSSIGEILQVITLTCMEATLRKKRGEKMRWGTENSAWMPAQQIRMCFSGSVYCAYTLDFG